MGIEALYPYIAVAYGTFGLVFGVALWWKTQRRIDRTRSAIEIQVANAVKDISSKVDTKLDALEMPDIAPIMAKIDSMEESIPDFDIEPLMAKLDSLERGLPDMVGRHISMAVRGAQGLEAKKIAEYVESLGIEGITEEAKEAAIERLTLKQRAAYQLMTMKVPARAKREHPISTMVFEQSRGLVAQQLIESDDAATGRVTMQDTGHNPGLRR